jgi:uncharacterized protein (DUF2141 family)
MAMMAPVNTSRRPLKIAAKNPPRSRAGYMMNKIANLSHISGTSALAASVPIALGLVASVAAVTSSPAAAAQQAEISNDLNRCAAGAGPALRVTVSDIKSSEGRIRVQTYRATKADWLERGKWINRIEVPATAGTMTFCLPIPQAGTYGVAIRHDLNGNGKTDITQDGGGMSNNPSINIFNLGKPSYSKVGVAVGNEVRSISIRMKYM